MLELESLIALCYVHQTESAIFYKKHPIATNKEIFYSPSLDSILPDSD